MSELQTTEAFFTISNAYSSEKGLENEGGKEKQNQRNNPQRMTPMKALPVSI